MSIVLKFSEYEQNTLNVISLVLSPEELQSLHPEDLDALQGQILYWLIKTGYTRGDAVKAVYRDLIKKRKNNG